MPSKMLISVDLAMKKNPVMSEEEEINNAILASVMDTEEYDAYQEFLFNTATNEIIKNLSESKTDVDLVKQFERFPKLENQIIADFYRSLMSRIPEKEMKAQDNEVDKEVVLCLTQFAEAFNSLVEHGARFEHLFLTDRPMFLNLVQVLNEESLTKGYLFALLLNSDFTFEQFKEIADILLEKGANINGHMRNNAAFLLNEYFCLERPDNLLLIDYFKSKNDTKRFNFDFKFQDKTWGYTAFLLSIYTGQEKVALKFLELNQQGFLIGIDTPNFSDVTPLMAASAMGMLEVVKELIVQGANKECVDIDCRHVLDYARFDKKQLQGLLRNLFLNPERGDKTNHSYLKDLKGSFLLFYDNSVPQESLDKRAYFVVLSPLPQYEERLVQVVNFLEEKAQKDPEAAALLRHVNEQIKNMGSRTMLALACEKNKLVAKFLDEKFPDTKRPLKSIPQSSSRETKDKNKPVLDLYSNLNDDSESPSVSDNDSDSDDPTIQTLYSQLDVLLNEREAKQAFDAIRSKNDHSDRSDHAESKEAHPIDILLTVIRTLPKDATRLDIPRCQLSKTSNAFISEFFNNLPVGINSINISDNLLGKHLDSLICVLQKLSERKNPLLKLNLSSNFQNIRYDDNKTIQLLRIFQQLFTFNELVTLNLSNNGLHLCFGFFCDHLKNASNSSLQLDLSTNELTNEDFEMLINSLPSGVISLDLSGNNKIVFTNEEVVDLVKKAKAKGFASKLCLITLNGHSLKFENCLSQNEESEKKRERSPSPWRMFRPSASDEASSPSREPCNFGMSMSGNPDEPS